MQAASLFRCDWDIAHLGLSSGTALSERTSHSAGPRTGPPAHATARSARERRVAHVLRVLGPAAVPLLLHVVVENRDVAAWCTAQEARPGGARPDPKKEFGRLLGVLDRLRELYGADARAEDR